MICIYTAPGLKQCLMKTHIGSLPYDIIAIINDHFTSLRTVIRLKHINRHWFNYSYFINTRGIDHNKLLEHNFRLIINNVDFPRPHKNILGMDLYAQNCLFNDSYIKNFPQLIHLTYYNSHFLTEKGFIHLKELKYLSCNVCKFSPAMLCYFPNLETLKLSNAIYDISQQPTFNLNIKYLMICRTYADDLWLQCMPNLTHLSCDDKCAFTNEGLSSLKHLEHLDCSEIKTITDEGLKNLPNLTNLECSNMITITNKGLRYIAKQLRYLRYEYCPNISSEGIKYLVNLVSLEADNVNDDALIHLTKLTYLNISEITNSVTDEGIKNLTQLKTLICSDNNHITEQGFKYLTNLINLDYSGNEPLLVITDTYTLVPFTGAPVFTKYLSKLKYLTCTGTMISDLHLQYLTNLKKLNCYDCPNITNEGIKSLTNLTHLNCSWCANITDEGIMNLSNLRNLICGRCTGITIKGINHLTNLTDLHCTYSPEFDDLLKSRGIIVKYCY